MGYSTKYKIVPYGIFPLVFVTYMYSFDFCLISLAVRPAFDKDTDKTPDESAKPQGPQNITLQTTTQENGNYPF